MRPTERLPDPPPPRRRVPKKKDRFDLIPSKLRAFLSGTLKLMTGEEVNEIWRYLDGNPDAVEDMIALLCRENAAKLKKFNGEDNER